MLKAFLCAVLVCLAVAVAEASGLSDERRSVVIYDRIATEVSAAEIRATEIRAPESSAPESSAPAARAKDLWVTMKDLKRATRFEVKPQGVCRDELCFPLPKKRKAEFISKKGAVRYFNLSEFARLIKQPVAFDEKHRVWYFGPLSEQLDDRLSNLEAPDFTLPDINGKRHSLSDFRGKKVLLLTWASW